MLDGARLELVKTWRIASKAASVAGALQDGDEVLVALIKSGIPTHPRKLIDNLVSWNTDSWTEGDRSLLKREACFPRALPLRKMDRSCSLSDPPHACSSAADVPAFALAPLHLPPLRSSGRRTYSRRHVRG
jgi:hypothetical protein